MSNIEFNRLLPCEQLEAVLGQYDLSACGPQRELGGGTASPKVILGTSPNRFLLRRRRREFSAPEVVAFDQAVIARLADCNIPVIPPVKTRDGNTAVWFDEWAFEVFGFVEGLEAFDPASIDQLAQGGDVLGRMHAATDGWLPPAPARKDWPREFRMASNIPALLDALADAVDAAASAEVELAQRMLAASEEVAGQLTDERYAALPAVVVHGDYTWANLKFRCGRLSGVFDFDWTYRQARLDDLARGLLFLAFPRAGTLDDSDIWRLVEPFIWDFPRARTFLDAYSQHHHLTGNERAMLPWYVRETWLSCRIRAMRKVPPEQRINILTFGMNKIFEQWKRLDELGAIAR